MFLFLLKTTFYNIIIWHYIYFAFQALTSTGIKKGELFLADVSGQLKNKNITTDIKVDTNSNVRH
jgi:hypothetical protein